MAPQSNNSHNSENTAEKKTPGFWAGFAELPASLQSRISKQIIGAIVICVLTIICIAFFRQWYYLIGFLFAAYVAWLGLRIIPRFQNGKIIQKHVIIIKAKHVLMKKTVISLALREAGADEWDEKGVMHFTISTDANTAALMTEGVKLNIYYDIEDPLELIAWKIVGTI